MKPIVKSKFILLAMSMIFSGCTASFEPRVSSSDLAKSRLPTAKEIKSGLEVSVEEYASPHKSRRAFDADIAPHGVLPLLLRVENKGTDNYKIQRSQIRAFLGGESLPPLQGYEAANQGAARDYVWNSLVNTAAIGPLAIYFWPATMALSAKHTQTVNQRIERHFESLELTDALVKADETVAGFVYFKLPDKGKSLENLSVEVTVEADLSEEPRGKQVTYRFSLPTLELSGS